MPDTPLRLLIIGAHPDDADYAAGGTAALYRAAGHAVTMISLTNGDAGHHLSAGPPLAERWGVRGAKDRSAAKPLASEIREYGRRDTAGRRAWDSIQ